MSKDELKKKAKKVQKKLNNKSRDAAFEALAKIAAIARMHARERDPIAQHKDSWELVLEFATFGQEGKSPMPDIVS